MSQNEKPSHGIEFVPVEEKIVILFNGANVSIYTESSKKIIVLDKLINDSVYQNGEDVITIKSEQYRFLKFSQLQGDTTQAIYNDVQRQRIEAGLEVIKQRLKEINSAATLISEETEDLEQARKQALEELKNLMEKK